jgi:hypothetical protein
MKRRTAHEMAHHMMALCEEVDQVLGRRNCTLEDGLLLAAYLYQKMEAHFMQQYPDDAAGAKRFLAIRFAKSIEGARKWEIHK